MPRAPLHNLEGWQLRVLNEHRDLKEKIERLNVFINTSVFKNTHEGDQARLTFQMYTMRAYLTALEARIDRFDYFTSPGQ